MSATSTSTNDGARINVRVAKLTPAGARSLAALKAHRTRAKMALKTASSNEAKRKARKLLRHYNEMLAPFAANESANGSKPAANAAPASAGARSLAALKAHRTRAKMALQTATSDEAKRKARKVIRHYNSEIKAHSATAA